MDIGAQISIYPLRQEHLSPTIEALRSALEAAALQPIVGPMSTTVRGNPEVVFAALREAFVQAMQRGAVVMTVTFSNACPI